MLCVTGSHAQLRELSAEQMLKNKRAGLLEDIPRVIRWADASNYILAKPSRNSKGFDTVVVNVRTGIENPYLYKRDPETRLKANDVFFTNADGIQKQLTNTKEEEKNPTLSPDGSKVAFTRNNDLYVTDIQTGVETRLTHDGSNVIYNGFASWVYFEEILGRASRYRAFWWSPDSKQIAFMRFDDSKVPVFPLYSSEGQHGFLENTRYPKAGDVNPEVKVGIASIDDNRKITWAQFNEKDDQYFGTPFWTPNNRLWLQWMNRDQDSLFVYAIDAATGGKQEMYRETQSTWVDWLENIHFLDNGNGFIITSDKSGWNHIYHYDMNGKLVKQVTNGKWTVKDISLINKTSKVIFFTARKEASTRFDLYSVKLDGSSLTRLTFGNYTHNVSVSPTGDHFITNYSNLTTPNRLALVETKNKNNPKQIADAKGKEYAMYAFANTELLRVKTGDGFELPVHITWPMNMDTTKKYPVLISIYGGPNAGTVTDGFKGIGMNQWWAKEGLIQVAIDHRGSGHFGKEGQNYLHRNLGEYEISDYKHVVRWLQQRPYIDKGKIAITGFSYGGYITCLALTKASDVFTHGIAGGSVTDWKLYDTHYTERYMDTPEDNADGYNRSSVFNHLDRYKGNLYIVHGTMDDNVHMQNSIQLISALQDRKKDFMMMFYPNGRHGWGNLPAKNAHFNNEKAKYYYQHLLNKPIPAEVLQ